ncbi:hypothetical protein SPLC1_S203100 [Arthrospira platensis C1]|nr:hypothetical protein SPLC1_S203100 [Arthrospira platensis C1]
MLGSNLGRSLFIHSHTRGKEYHPDFTPSRRLRNPVSLLNFCEETPYAARNPVSLPPPQTQIFITLSFPSSR